MSSDYPFADCATYYDAFVSYLSSDLYSVEYPQYAAMHADMGYVADINIVKAFLLSECPQKVLDGFIEAIIRGTRYSKDFIECPAFQTIIQSCLSAGAVINLDLILKPYIATDASYFEDEASCFHVQGALLFYIQQEFIADLCDILDEKIGWKLIEPAYWEDIDHAREDFDTMRYKSIKYEYAMVRHAL